MSQEKVNVYKESKANRKAEVEKARNRHKRRSIAATVVPIAVGVLLAIALVFTGITIVNDYISSQPDYENTKYMLEQYVTTVDNSTLPAGIQTAEGASIEIKNGDESSAEEETKDAQTEEAQASTEEKAN